MNSFFVLDDAVASNAFSFSFSREAGEEPAPDSIRGAEGGWGSLCKIALTLALSRKRERGLGWLIR
jgi:hypothetical protein